MKTKTRSYSPNISQGLIQRRSNIIFEKIVRFLFRKVDFDDESLTTLKKYAGQGAPIFTTMQTTNTSLLLLVHLLRKHELTVPVYARGFTPYWHQVITNLFRRIIRIFSRFFRKKKYEQIPDFQYLVEELTEKKSMVLALFARKLFLRRYLQTRTDSIQYLIEAQKKMDTPIFIFPQIMFWNRNPERTKTLVTSKATGDRGLLSALFTKIKSATPAFMRVGEPLNLKEEIAKTPDYDPKYMARRIRDKLLEVYNHEERSILGPVIKSQQEMMEKVLYHKNVLDAIQQVMKEEGTSEKKLRKKAYNYYKEIAADFSIIYIRFFEKSLDYIFHRIFDGVYFDQEDFKMLREASQNGPLILMPSHKSHMDYLIISSIFYQNKLIPPHILAGSNLTFFPMGKIFRRSGAFFMRRSFKGKTLYTSLLKQYIKSLVNEGYSIEFFIEGGRTRSGKLSPPKMGILKYLIESIDEGYNKDLMLVPITINYDRILEETSYHKELKGKDKESESTSGFVQSRKLLKRKYGRVYLSFNKPISFQDLRKKYGDSEDITTSVANHILQKINDITMVTPFALTTAAILLSSKRGFSRDMIKEKFIDLHDYFKYLGIRMSDLLYSESSYDDIIDYVLEAYSEDQIVTQMEIEESKSDNSNPLTDLYVLNEEDRARINFYKNNIINFLVPVSLISLAVLRSVGRSGTNSEKITVLYKEIKELFSKEFIFTEDMDDIDKSLVSILKYLEKKSIISVDNAKITITEPGLDELTFYARVVQDYLESYLIVLSTLVPNGKKKRSKKDIIYDIRKNGIKMYHLGEIQLLESLSMPNYTNALGWLKENGFTSEKQVGKKARNIDLTPVDIKKIGDTRDSIKECLSIFSQG
ncbi:MAG: hypothetical protein GY754_08445 [bacterium]|nr:hypothetical protein [bacterium]